MPEKEIGKKEAGRNYPIIRDINTKSYNTGERCFIVFAAPITEIANLFLIFQNADNFTLVGAAAAYKTRIETHHL